MNESDKNARQSRIKSYILRQGRATVGQQNAIDTLWEHYCLNPHHAINLDETFGQKAPLILEIGFGNGSCLAEMAKNHPESNFLGIEVHRPGVGHLMMLLNKDALNNVRIYHHDAVEIIEQRIPDNSLSAVHLFFPDPWHKRRHHKRRIVRPEFIHLVQKKLKIDGYFHAATDWEDYAKKMLSTLNQCPQLSNVSNQKNYCPRPDYRPMTKFEKRGLNLGHGVWDLIFKKTTN